MKKNTDSYNERMKRFDNYWGYQTEVIGNIFDNAELLEVE